MTPSLLLVLLTAAHAADPGTTAQEVLDGLLTAHAADGLTASPEAAHPWAAGTRVRARQRIRGVPVLGNELIVSVDLDGEVVRVDGEPLRTVVADVTPRVLPLTAEHTAQRAAWDRAGDGEAWTPHSALRVWIDPLGASHLVWQVDVGVTHPFSTWRALVDAHTGELLTIAPSLMHARGNVYPTNPEVSTLTEVDLPPTNNDVLSGPYAFVSSCDNFNGQSCTAKSSHAVADSNGDFLFTPDPTSTVDPFAEVQMYYQLDLVSRWWESEHGVTLDPIEGLVNFDYDNAFFGDADGDGKGEVAFGQTNIIDYSYDADVIYHEFSHAVFGALVDPGFFAADTYGLDFSTGSLNEGTADLFSVLLTGDPNLGEYAGTGILPYNDPIRKLDSTLRCPDDLYGEVHVDGEIWASLGWAMMEDPRIGAAVTGDLVYGALLSWRSDVNWEEAGQSLVDSAGDLLAASAIDQTTHDAIIEVGEASGVIGCGRVIALDAGQESTQWMVHPGFLGDDIHVPLQSQFSIEVPQYSEEVQFRVTDFQASSSNLGFNVYVRRGEPIVHDFVSSGGFDRPYPSVFDAEFSGDSGSWDLSLTPDTELALEPGATYFFSVASNANGSVGGFAYADISIEAEVWVGEPPVEEEEEVKACGCSAASPVSLGWLLLGLPALVVLRRRR